MNPTILGVIGPGFLNQVPTLNTLSPACFGCRLTCNLGVLEAQVRLLSGSFLLLHVALPKISDFRAHLDPKEPTTLRMKP